MSGSLLLQNGDRISFNYKCIAMSIFFAGFYWFAPPKNKWVLVGILYLTYLALAWYDHIFDCKNNSLKPTFLYSFYGFLKPKDYQADYEKWKPETKSLVARGRCVHFVASDDSSPVFAVETASVLNR